MESIYTEEKTAYDNFETDIRPQSLDEYVGQEEVKENIRIFIEAAKKRNEPLKFIYE